MGLNAISEFGQRDAGVARITRHAARRQRQTLMRVLTRAQTQKDIRSDADLDSMADFFESRRRERNLRQQSWLTQRFEESRPRPLLSYEATAQVAFVTLLPLVPSSLREHAKH